MRASADKQDAAATKEPWAASVHKAYLYVHTRWMCSAPLHNILAAMRVCKQISAPRRVIDPMICAFAQHDEFTAMIKDAQTIAELRVLVGYLGEQQPAWWPSQFFSPTAAAFLGPVFARSTLLAQYQGVTAAAARKHEEHIGEGKTFHLYRLPEVFEQSAAGVLSDKAFEARVRTLVASRDKALGRLAELAGGPVNASEGPVVIGDLTDELSDALKSCAALYLDAISKGIQCFPFLREAQ